MLLGNSTPDIDQHGDNRLRAIPGMRRFAFASSWIGSPGLPYSKRARESNAYLRSGLV